VILVAHVVEGARVSRRRRFMMRLHVVLGLILVTSAACRTNQLAIYANDSMDMAVVGTPAPGARPAVATGTSNAKDPVSAGVDMAADAVAVGVQQRLEKIAPVDSMSPKVVERVSQGVPQYLPKTKVTGGDASNVRLEITVTSYGVTTSGADVSAFMNVSARMVHLKVGDKIWETWESVRLPLRTVPGIIDVLPGGDVVSLAVLAGFSDEQWQRLMDELCKAAADSVLEQIRLDAVG
jgi:hypothetical protein